MARKMTNKQKTFLSDFEKSMRVNDQADKFLNGDAPYKNGIHVLSAENLREDQWMELVSMNDFETLWHSADRFLSDLGTQKKD